VSARDELDQIRQRHDEDHEHPAGEVCDNRAMVAALTAALDLADDPDRLDRDAALDIRAAITEHLTSKETDS